MFWSGSYKVYPYKSLSSHLTPSNLNSGAAVDEHLGDQLLPYLALAPGRSEILIQGVSSHLRTNLWVVNQFMPSRLTLEEKQGLGKAITTTG